MKCAKITALVIVMSLMLGVTAFARQIPNATPRFTHMRKGAILSAKQLDEKYHGNAAAGIKGNALAAQMPFWVGKTTVPFGVYNANNVNFYYDMIGTNPALGNKTTTIPVVIIPVIFTWGTTGGGTDDPTQAACFDPNSKSPITRIQESMIFTPYAGNYPGPAPTGSTGQYEDAFQKANWNKVNVPYHVLLNATVAAPITIDGTTAGFPVFNNACGQAVGEFDIFAFDSIIESVYQGMGIPKTTLPLFISYNVFLTEFGGCCILGYHSSDAVDQTYSFAAYNDPGLFTASQIQDVHALSHELGEWMDDPFGLNPTPNWGGLGQVPGCQNNLEVGDPVTGIGFPSGVSMPPDNFVYHPEDLVFHGWFFELTLNNTPSGSAGGAWTFLQTFTGSAKPNCSGSF